MQKGSWLTEKELESAGFRKYGVNVKISSDARILNPENFECGDNVRIDALSMLTGKISLGSYIHISPFCLLQGSGGGITLKDFAAFSGGVKAYTSDADYSHGGSLTNPTIPAELKKSTNGPIMLEEHVLVGANSVILPNTTLHQGAIFGSMSFIKGEYTEWNLYVGIPAKKIRERPKEVIKKNEQKVYEIDRKNGIIK